MKHFLYAMLKDDRDPTGTGDTLSWFNHYKVQQGETFVPVKGDLYMEASPGDTLLFLMDGFFIGYSHVIRTEHGPGGLGEVWYNSDSLSEVYPAFFGPGEQYTVGFCVPQCRRMSAMVEASQQLSLALQEMIDRYVPFH